MTAQYGAAVVRDVDVAPGTVDGAVRPEEEVLEVGNSPDCVQEAASGSTPRSASMHIGRLLRVTLRLAEPQSCDEPVERHPTTAAKF